MARPEFSPDIMVSDNYDIIGNQSVYGLQTINNVPTPIKVGADELQGRTSLSIQVLQGVLLLGLDATLSNEKFFMRIAAGERLQLIVSNNTEITIFGKAYSGYCKLALLEIVS